MKTIALAILALSISGCASVLQPNPNAEAPPPADSTAPFIVNTNLTSLIERMRLANAALNPTPTAPLVNLGLAGFSACLTILAAYKNDKARRSAKSLQSVVAGVELAGDKKTKDQIAKMAGMLGSAADLAKTVQTVTRTTAR